MPRRYSLYASSVAVAEALAILRGCELGIFLGFNSVIIESDSLESCQRDVLANGSWETFPALIKSKKFGESFQDYRWSWIPRLANMVADHLTSQQSQEMCDFTWVNRPPSFLVHVLNNDGFPCPPSFVMIV
ncbi:hypothetical protein DVH24_031444 [Malus domestica]|uniref:RNase H type-1 domain-containing protein n=1 Tax=Malus domestica TaxID=3750 RepID=A0A498HIZ9_MALDO|nr:hypothetical protein DVH24_031444 [Malus domestica]